MRVFRFLYRILKDRIIDVLNLSEGTDPEGTINVISSDVSIRGANAWILICGAMLASIGLDVNSSAVIIGAMLISPLMSSILGVGLGVGINDRTLFFSAFKNFLAAMMISLLTSVVYFSMTPLGEITPEMTARIRPTLLDVGVAIFGGVAGIIANSRKEKTNAIPGVAIATALMPPLCTAGFGLATGRMEYFLGAFYLFFINAFFISFVTYVVVRLLRFPYKTRLDDQVRGKMKKGILAASIIVMIPSGIIFYDVIRDADLEKTVSSFIDEYIRTDDRDVLRWEKNETDSVDYLKMYVVGKPIDAGESKKLDTMLAGYEGRFFFSTDISEMKLKLVQMNVTKEERDQMLNDVALNVMKQIEFQKKVETQLDRRIDSLQSEYEKIRIDSNIVRKIFAESSVWFPELKAVSFGFLTSVESSTVTEYVPTALVDYEIPKRARKGDYESKLERLRKYINLRLEKDTVTVLPVRYDK